MLVIETKIEPMLERFASYTPQPQKWQVPKP